MGRASNEEPPKRALVLVRGSEARLRELADSAPVAALGSGMDVLCSFFNRSWLEVRRAHDGGGAGQQLGRGRQ